MSAPAEKFGRVMALKLAAVAVRNMMDCVKGDDLSWPTRLQCWGAHMSGLIAMNTYYHELSQATEAAASRTGLTVFMEKYLHKSIKLMHESTSEEDCRKSLAVYAAVLDAQADGMKADEAESITDAARKGLPVMWSNESIDA